MPQMKDTVNPTSQEPPTKKGKLTARERDKIDRLHSKGQTHSAIAKVLGRHRSSIGREIKRNREKDSWGFRWYCSRTAQEICVKRKSESNTGAVRMAYEPLRKYVAEKLIAQWSPETISGHLPLAFPDDPKMRISHEAIYKGVYSLPGRRVLMSDCLLRKHRQRKPRNRGTARSRHQIIKDRKGIELRPAEVEDRAAIGHLEGDTMLGKPGTGGVVTQVDRASRFLFADKIENKEADTVAKAMTNSLKHLPKGLLKTNTLDNGSEFSKFKEVEKALGISIYFAHPYSSWERGTNENTNGRLRMFFKKGIDFKTATQEQVQAAAAKMNATPRKCLGYRTPAEVFNQGLRDFRSGGARVAIQN